MYDINTKNVKKGINFYLGFFVIGLFLLTICGAVPISYYVELNSLDSTTTSTNVIVNLHTDYRGGTSYYQTHYYTVDGSEYSCDSYISSGSNPGTSNKKVYYDSKNPSKCITEESDIVLLMFALLPLFIIVFAVINMIKIRKRLKLINELNKKGKLVKNLPYLREDTGMRESKTIIYRPVVEYTLASGSTITLYGDPRFDKRCDKVGMIDLIIDENNPNNYFIDFEINRLTGNLPSDYYNNMSNNELQSNNSNYQTNNQYQNLPNNGRKFK